MPSRILISGLNWIGDNIMAMPALQAFCALHEDDDIAILVKSGLAPLWKMSDAVNRVIPYEDTHAGTFAAGRALRAEKFDACYILPHSFRSAWVPFLARIPARVGLRGGFRDALLTRTIHPPREGHQQFEYVELLCPGAAIDAPRLRPPPDAVSQARGWLAALPRPLVAITPGAARGPSKRWPARHFVEAAHLLARERGAGLVVFGASGENELCAEVADATGALNLCGRTTLPTWAAALAACDLALCNDSGGMHLAASVGTRVVAVYGMTDPTRTGPLGPRARVIQDEGPRGRDIERVSAEAEKRLAAIAPRRVYEAAVESLST